MKKLTYLCLVLPAMLSGLPGGLRLVQAEHLCQVEITYQWKKEDAETEIKEQWGRLEARGTDEKEAKAKLQKITDPERIFVLGRCRREHENQSACVATRFTSYSATLQSLSFTARKKLEDSILADCKLAAGTCTGVLVSDPVCTEIVVAAAPEKGAKDAKPKKK